MAALLCYFALFYHQDLVSLADSAEAVRDDECGTALHQGFEAGLYQAFTFGVEVGGSFVEDKNARISKYGSCDGNTLSLSSR